MAKNNIEHQRSNTEYEDRHAKFNKYTIRHEATR